jgi:type IV secretory pathway VirB4 component
MNEVQEVVKEVKAEVVKVEGEVVAEVAKIEKAVEKVIQELTAEEKLAIREIENAYLKAQMEIQRLSEITKKAQKDFTETVEKLTKKYVVNPATWLFDNVELVFKKR